MKELKYRSIFFSFFLFDIFLIDVLWKKLNVFSYIIYEGQFVFFLFGGFKSWRLCKRKKNNRIQFESNHAEIRFTLWHILNISIQVSKKKLLTNVVNMQFTVIYKGEFICMRRRNTLSFIRTKILKPHAKKDFLDKTRTLNKWKV